MVPVVAAIFTEDQAAIFQVVIDAIIENQSLWALFNARDGCASSTQYWQLSEDWSLAVVWLWLGYDWNCFQPVNNGKNLSFKVEGATHPD